MRRFVKITWEFWLKLDPRLFSYAGPMRSSQCVESTLYRLEIIQKSAKRMDRRYVRTTPSTIVHSSTSMANYTRERLQIFQEWIHSFTETGNRSRPNNTSRRFSMVNTFRNSKSLFFFSSFFCFPIVSVITPSSSNFCLLLKDQAVDWNFYNIENNAFTQPRHAIPDRNNLYGLFVTNDENSFDSLKGYHFSPSVPSRFANDIVFVLHCSFTFSWIIR